MSMPAGIDKIIIADVDAFTRDERLRLEDNGFFIIFKTPGRDVTVWESVPLYQASLVSMQDAIEQMNKARKGNKN